MPDVTRCLRSVLPACCAFVVSCNFLVGVHDLPFLSSDAGDEIDTPDETTPLLPDVSDSDDAPAATRDAGGDDAAPEGAESTDAARESQDASDEEATDPRDATPPFDTGADDGKSAPVDAGEAGPPSDAGTNDGGLPVIEAGGLPDAASDSNSADEDAGYPDSPSGIRIDDSPASTVPPPPGVPRPEGTAPPALR